MIISESWVGRSSYNSWANTRSRCVLLHRFGYTFFKYVFNGFDRDELYDLRVDPHEMRNLADDPAYAAVVREMCGRLWRFACREGDAAINPYITVGLAPYGPAEAFHL